MNFSFSPIKISKISFVVIAIFILQGCSKTTFKGIQAEKALEDPGKGIDAEPGNNNDAGPGNNNKPGKDTFFSEPTVTDPNQTLRTLSLSCAETLSTEKTIGPGNGADLQVAEDSELLLKIKGRFCREDSSSDVTVLFIIDYSSSMGRHMAFDKEFSGSDPRQDKNGNTSCGRLDAARAVVKNFTDSSGIKLGVLPFASKTYKPNQLDPIKLDEFSEQFLEGQKGLESFCSNIFQDALNDEGISDLVPGEINSGGYKGSTNYEDAFKSAYRLLLRVEGRKVIYFITDGLPTTSNFNGDPKRAAKAAADRLQGLDNLTLYSFILDAEDPSEKVEGYETLVDIVGSSNRVKRVKDAHELSVEAGKVEELEFNSNSIEANLTIDSLDVQKTLSIEKFSKDTRGVWIFETEEFLLQNQAQAQVRRKIPHIIEVKATSTDGAQHKGNIQIIYETSD